MTTPNEGPSGWLTRLVTRECRDRHTVVSKPLDGRSVVVLAGGPGLTMEAASDLVKWPHLAVNNSYLLSRHPTAVVALDRRWWEWHGAELRNRGDTGFTALRPRQAFPRGFHGLALNKDAHGAYSHDAGTLCGTNSGHAAVHLAAHLGAARIFLAGFDMTFRNDRTHWHGGHKVPASLVNYERRFRPQLEELVTRLDRELGVRVEAITPSAAKVPHLDLSEALAILRNDHGNCMDHPAPSTPVPI